VTILAQQGLRQNSGFFWAITCPLCLVQSMVGFMLNERIWLQANAGTTRSFNSFMRAMGSLWSEVYCLRILKMKSKSA